MYRILVTFLKMAGLFSFSGQMYINWKSTDTNKQVLKSDYLKFRMVYTSRFLRARWNGFKFSLAV